MLQGWFYVGVFGATESNFTLRASWQNPSEVRSQRAAAKDMGSAIPGYVTEPFQFNLNFLSVHLVL